MKEFVTLIGAMKDKNYEWLLRMMFEDYKNIPLNEIGITIATPFPNTKLYDDCLHEGYIQPFNYENYPADNDIWHRDAVISTPWLSAQELVAFKAKFYHDFNRSSWRKSRRHVQRRILMKMRTLAEKRTTNAA